MKHISWLLVLTLIFSLATMGADTAQAQTKIIKKTVKKVVTPEIAPAQPPQTEPTPEAVPEEVPPPPPPPPAYETEVLKKDTGIFGWGMSADVSGNYTYNRGQQGLLGLLLARGDILFDDPLALGERLGLAEDAVQYKLGLGLALGSDVNEQRIFSIPVFAGANIYLKEGSLGGMDPFVGAGLNLNLLGSDAKMGGMGTEIYGGVLVDLGFEAGKTEFSVGYNTLRISDSYLSEGIILSVTQPLII